MLIYLFANILFCVSFNLYKKVKVNQAAKLRKEEKKKLLKKDEIFRDYTSHDDDDVTIDMKRNNIDYRLKFSQPLDAREFH